MNNDIDKVRQFCQEQKLKAEEFYFSKFHNGMECAYGNIMAYIDQLPQKYTVMDFFTDVCRKGM